MRVLVVAAHPDDELLGVGGTLARHGEAGDSVTCLIVSEGASSRYQAGAENSLQSAGRNAAAVVGAEEIRFLGLPDQKLDTVPLIDVIQSIEDVVKDVRPEQVYTHHWGDLNRDHRVVSEAMMVACRPVGETFPRRVLCFETPSSTEWSAPEPGAAFLPNHFVDITATIDKKIEAFECYTSEIRPAPHPRSGASLRSRAQYWGQTVRCDFAEAFVLVRHVE